MLSIQTILDRLTKAVSGTDKSIFTDEERSRFAEKCQKHFDESTTDVFIVNDFLDFWWETDRNCRRCSVCGKLFRAGYCQDAGASYYCSDDCLHTEFSDDEWEEECQENDQSYFTEW